MSRSSSVSPLGLWIISAYKFAKALALVALGIVVLRLAPDDFTAGLLRVAVRLRLDADDRVIHKAIATLSGLSERQLESVGAGMVLYGLLYVVEGAGLLFQRRWAEYLVILSTGSLIPFESYEVVRSLGTLRVTVLLVNIVIVAYLIRRIRREGRSSRSDLLAEPASGPGTDGPALVGRNGS